MLEGATLGGRYVAPRLENSLGLAEGVGSSYFRSYGERVQPMWSALCELLQADSHPAHDDRISFGACDMFASLHRWLARGHLA